MRDESPGTIRESARRITPAERGPSADQVLLLGPLQVIQNGAQLPLPPSRKVRALLAYLAMAPRPVTREKLCELFWDVADDSRSELRWCLSKLRPMVDAPTTTRLIADRERVWNGKPVEEEIVPPSERTLRLAARRGKQPPGFLQVSNSDYGAV
jgi:hypothetical protein